MDQKPLTRKPRGLKIALIVILALFILFAAGIYLLPHFLPINTIRGIVKAKGRELAGVDVDFQGLGFSWSGGVVLDGITVSPMAEEGAAAEGEAAKPLLTVDEARANVSFMPLLSGKIVVNSVVVDGFAVRLRRDENGKLNLPDLSKLSKPTAMLSRPAHRTRERHLLSAMAAETPFVLPPIELHRVDMRRGILAFEDLAADMAVDVGLDFFRLEGSTLNDPFLFSGRLLPYPRAPERGDIPFAGRVALVKDGALNPDGEASLEVHVNAVSLAEMAEELGLGNLLASGQVNGTVKAGYASRKGLLSVNDMRLTDTAVGMGGDKRVGLPDTSATLNVEFDPGPGLVIFRDMAVLNDFVTMRGQGQIDGVMGIADGRVPGGAIDFSGTTDFGKLSDYMNTHDLGVEGLPVFEGRGNFSGRATVARNQNATDPLAPTLVVEFQDGQVAARDTTNGIVANVGLAGIGLRAVATLGDSIDMNSSVNLANVPAAVVVPNLSPEPIQFTINGGAAVSVAENAGAIELRAANSVVRLPATQWSGPMNIVNPETRVTYDLAKDELNVLALTVDVNDGLRGGVSSARIAGIMTGKPQGEAVLDLSAVLDRLQPLLQPLVPGLFTGMAGNLRAATRVRFADGGVEAVTQAEVDEADVTVNFGSGMAKVASPRSTVVVSAGLKLEKPLAVSINNMILDNDGGTLQLQEQGGVAVAGRLGKTRAQIVGVVDTGSMRAELSNLNFTVNGMAMAIGRGTQESAGLDSGVMQLVVATPENKLSVPLGLEGIFAMPALEAGADNLVFHRMVDNQRQESDFGSIRARLGVDGYVGAAERQIVNLRTASLSAKPLAAEARGQVDLGSGALVAVYAARLAPAGMSSLLAFLKLPPALLAAADVRGSLSWNGTQLDSKGEVKGQLQMASREINPFAMAHDVSAAVNKAEQSLAVSVRALNGNVQTASGEAVVTLTAQPSNLLLSRAGSKGMLDIRLNGSAAPTRMLALGLVGILPTLGDYTNILYNTQADGVYQAWLQVRDKDSSSIGLNMGGNWQGAALRVNNVPYLAEPGSLSAMLEGDFNYRNNRVEISRMLLRSESGQMQADGAVNAALATDGQGSITGVGNLAMDFKFVAADLSRVALAFPGVLPQDLALTGRIDGAFQAGGDANDIRVQQGRMNFQGFQLRKGTLEAAVPSGVANFDATISLHLNNAASGPPSSFEVFRMFNIANGQAALTGAQFMGRQVETMTGAFQLQNGVLTLQSAQLAVGEGGGVAAGGVRAEGVVDFNQAAPATNLRVAISNLPLSLVNENIRQYMQIQSGVINIPATQGQAAGVAFVGVSEDEIFQTVRLDNFNFATGEVVLTTGELLNRELDKAKGLMHQEVTETGKERVISFRSITGTVMAGGDGVIGIVPDNPLLLVGDNISDFRVYGNVYADHTMNLNFAITGQLEKLIGFSLPNLIPNLRKGTDEEKNRFMAKMNDNAAKGHYNVNVTGSLSQPDLSGIEKVVLRFMTDVVGAAPAQIIGGIIDLGKDAPGTVLNLGKDAAGAVLNLPQTVTNTPGAVVRAPKELGKELGRMFGVGRRDRSSGEEQGEVQEE